MKKLGYYFFKYWVKLGLFFYFKKVRVVGVENIPLDKPILFLSNHQNALLDVLLIAIQRNLKPWYLTRSDVFKSKLFSPLFYFLQMLPIYRIRDGKDTLSKNKAIFNRCGELLNDNEMLLIFPEANHNLKRRVRPLSKGFTRIIFTALEQNPYLDLQLIPIGQNYVNAACFPDSAALHFGKGISVQELLTDNAHTTTLNLKFAVLNELKQLTTHIENDATYDTIVEALEDLGADFLNPVKVNAQIPKLKTNKGEKTKSKFNLTKALFVMLNLPIILIWRVFIKPKVPELEFMSTFRFVYSMLAYPIFYTLLILILTNTYNIKTACLIVIGHAALNLLFVKIGFTSSAQKR